MKGKAEATQVSHSSPLTNSLQFPTKHLYFNIRLGYCDDFTHIKTLKPTCPGNPKRHQKPKSEGHIWLRAKTLINHRVPMQKTLLWIRSIEEHREVPTENQFLRTNPAKRKFPCLRRRLVRSFSSRRPIAALTSPRTLTLDVSCGLSKGSWQKNRCPALI